MKACEMLTITARSPKGTKVGSAFTFPASAIPKRDLVAWAFQLVKSYKITEEAVDCFALRSAGSSFTRPGLLPGVPNLPTRLLIKPPLYHTGKTGNGGSSDGNISKTQVAYMPHLDMSGTTDLDEWFSPAAVYRITWVDNRLGVELPKWRSIIKAGGNATTAMTAQRGKAVQRAIYAEVQYKRPVDKKVLKVQLSGYPVMPTPTVFSVAGLETSSNTLALAKLHTKLYDLRHDARIGETVGEWRQSMLMVKRPLDGMRRLMSLYRARAQEVVRNAERRVGRSLSRFDKGDAQEVTSSLASLYLEFNFGWIPLAKDLHAAFKAWEAKRNGIKTVVNASYASDGIYSDQTVAETWNSYIQYNTRVIKQVKIVTRYKVGIDPTAVRLGGYLERIGLTPQEFIPTLYAILPYSWLVDYFTNINVVIDSLMADLSFTTWTCKTVRKTCMTMMVVTPNLPLIKASLGTNFRSATASASESQADMVVVARSIPSNLIAAPTLKLPKAMKPWVNMTALVVQRKVGTSVRVLDPILGQSAPLISITPLR